MRARHPETKTAPDMPCQAPAPLLKSHQPIQREPAMNAHSVPHETLEIQLRDGEPRVLDTHLARRLGFGQERDIRKLIARHRGALDELAPRSTVERGANGGDATEYYLNRKQALFITTKSETDKAIEQRAT